MFEVNARSDPALTGQLPAGNPEQKSETKFNKKLEVVELHRLS